MDLTSAAAPKTALICGIGGQDGSLLARLELGWSASSDMPEVVARMCRESLV